MAIVLDGTLLTVSSSKYNPFADIVSRAKDQLAC